VRARILTALALIPPVLAAVFCTNSWPIFVLAIILFLPASREIANLIRGKNVFLGSLLWLGLAIATIAANPRLELDYRYLAVVGLAVFAVGVLATWRAARRRGSNHLENALAGGWAAGPLAAILGIHLATSGATPPWFRFEMPLLMAIVPLWAGDTAAIFAGRAFGKRLLAPSISPKKTVEGAAANFIACMIAAWGLGYWLRIPIPQSLVCGVIAGLFGQAGDLFESWVKRQADLKDSGNLLPGHGGIMDRIDSFLFTAPFVALVLLFWR
jgi:phosphatidate cytidylyltransferase